jgi:23S rRNA (guanine745-N1)-methyltransferase
MLSDVLAYLACPACGSEFVRAEGSLCCSQGHSFDVARQGYVNLVAGGGARAAVGDIPEMVQARADFLGAGHYEPIALAVADMAARHLLHAEARPDGCVVDVGAGTGYYLERVLDALPDRVGLALDASKYAARRAARAHERAGAVVCDTWGAIPLRDACAALVLDVFAPRNAAEFSRVLAAGGILVVVTPTSGHLGEVVASLGLLTVDAQKSERVEEQLGELFARVESVEVEHRMHLSHADVRALVGMGPSARHTEASALAASIHKLPEPLAVTASVYIAVYVAAADRRAPSA